MLDLSRLSSANVTMPFEGQLDLDPERLVFIDETSANTKMARFYGRSPRGERCRAAVPHGHVWTPLPMQEEL